MHNPIFLLLTFLGLTVCTTQATIILIDNTNDIAGNSGHLINVSGGNLFKSINTTTFNGLIGSNAADENTWGTGRTSGATGADLGATWRMAATTKIGTIVDVDAGDDFNTLADLAQDLQITVQLGIANSGAANQPDYVPLAYLYGVDTVPSGTGGWWGTAERVTQAVTSSTTLTPGVFNAANSTWSFAFHQPGGLVSADAGDILGVAIVGSRDPAADEFLSFAESRGGITDSSFNITTIPEPGSLGLLALGAIGLLALRRR